MLRKIKKSISGTSDEMLSAQVGYLIERTTSNPNFPTPNPTMPALATKRTAFDRAVDAVRAGDHTKERVLIKENLRKELKDMVGLLFNYVVNVGKTVEIQLTSGFPLAKEKASVGTLPMPSNFTVRSTVKNKVNARCKAIHGADTYMYQYTLSPNPEVDNWVTMVETRSFTEINNLTSGTQYKFRMCGVGAKGQGEWSSAITCYVL